MARSHLATRTKFKGRRRRPLQSPPDKPGICQGRRTGETYLVTMSLPDGVKSRDEIFMDWIAEQFRELKRKRVSRTDAAARGKVSRNATYEWEGRGQKGFARPTPEKIKDFCLANGLDWTVPFRIYGWDVGRQRPMGIDARIDRIRRVLELPGLDTAARRDLEIELVRLRAVQRMSHEAVEAADEVLDKYEGGAA